MYPCSCMRILTPLRVLPCIETLIEQVVCLKRLVTTVFNMSYLLYMFCLYTTCRNAAGVKQWYQCGYYYFDSTFYSSWMLLLMLHMFVCCDLCTKTVCYLLLIATTIFKYIIVTLVQFLQFEGYEEIECYAIYPCIPSGGISSGGILSETQSHVKN